MAGQWTGTYACAQGVTGLSLRIAGNGPGALTATFEFFPVPQNPAVPQGSFTMTGSAEGSRITLDGQQWVNRPTGYQLVNLAGTVRAGNPDRIEGNVRDAAGCTTFSVQRTPSEES